jgi:hypothetical protein
MMEAITIQATQAVRDRNIAERRLTALVTAVREHERAQRRKPYPRRGDDLSLYRRVREILGED